jgi:hypothetical protein
LIIPGDAWGDGSLMERSDRVGSKTIKIKIKTISLDLLMQRMGVTKVDVIKMLEAKLGYAFSVKGLLLEALTHPSHQESAESYSYQVLVDVTCYSYWCLLIFIMQFLYQKHHMFFVTASGIPWRCCLGYSINTTSFQ